MKETTKNNKQMVRVGLLQNEINLINEQAKINGESVSQTARILILRGLENLEIADNLKDSVNFQIAKLDRNQKEFDKKIMKILMLIFKTSFVGKDFIATFNRKSFPKSDEEFKAYLNKLEENAIKKALRKLGENEDEEI